MTVNGAFHGGPGGSGLDVNANDVKITVGATGVIAGGNGISADFANTSIVNHGTIEGIGNWSGIDARGSSLHLDNSGMLRGGFAGIYGYGPGHEVINEKSGYILSGSNAVRFDSSAGDKTVIVNHGTISSDSWSLYFGAGDERVVNDGRIVGSISLGAGNDYIDTRNGTFKGRDIYGEAGNDVLVTDNAAYGLEETPGNGTDTVKSTVSYTLGPDVENLVLLVTKSIAGIGNDGANKITGNAGNNTLTGLAGADRLDGGKGSDKLIGGSGGDTFGFATGYGKDEIKDFSRAEGDTIYIHNWKAFDSFSDVKAHAKNHGDDVWITSGHDTLVIDDMQVTQLKAGDFDF